MVWFLVGTGNSGNKAAGMYTLRVSETGMQTVRVSETLRSCSEFTQRFGLEGNQRVLTATNRFLDD